MVRMLSSSRLKGKLQPEWGWGCERCLRRPQAASPEAVRMPNPLPDAATGTPGQGAGLERELEEDDVEEEVEEEEGEGKVGTAPKGLSSSSTSKMDGSHGGTGIHGCQPGVTEHDLSSVGLRSSLCCLRDAELWLP